MTKSLAPLAVEAFSVEDDPELVAIAARLSETASSAINPAFKEDLRETRLHQFKDHFASSEVMTQSQAVEICEQMSRDALILIYLNHIDALLRRFAASAHLDYEDLRQDAVLVIMHCLDRKPEQQSTLHGYIYTSVRHRILDKIRYNQSHQAESLDLPASRVASNERIGDLLPSGYSIDPLLVILEKEARLHARRQVKEALRSLPAKRLKTKRVQRAIAFFEEEEEAR